MRGGGWLSLAVSPWQVFRRTRLQIRSSAGSRARCHAVAAAVVAVEVAAAEAARHRARSGDAGGRAGSHAGRATRSFSVQLLSYGLRHGRGGGALTFWAKVSSAGAILGRTERCENFVGWAKFCGEPRSAVGAAVGARRAVNSFCTGSPGST